MSGEWNAFIVAVRCVCEPANGCIVVGTSLVALTVTALRPSIIGALSPEPASVLPHVACAVALPDGCQNACVAVAGAASGPAFCTRSGGGVAHGVPSGKPDAALYAA